MAQPKASLLGRNYRRIQPKLRMIANGDELVNIVRAEHCSAIAAPQSDLVKTAPLTRGLGAAPVQRAEIPEDVTKKSLKAVPDTILADVFVQTEEREGRRTKVPGQTASRGNLRTATIPLAELRSIANRPSVTYVELGQPLSAPTPEIAESSPAAPSSELRDVGGADRHKYGEHVLIGIIDCEGFDFRHPDFLDDDGKTRWVAIWDQGGAVRPSPQGFGYGSEFRAEHLNAAIAAAADAGVEAYELEPQSQMAEGSHGTHVASIAAGNAGVCRKARIAGVLVSLAEEDHDRRKSFYDSTRLAHAVEYLVALAKELRLPLSINISLGTNGHAHDGSAAVSRWIDSALAVPGHSVCTSAGNAGQEAAEYEGDIGWIMGRIHTESRIPAQELTSDIEWLVVGNGIADISENELEIWYGPQDRLNVSVRPPGGEWIGPIQPGQFIENRQLPDGSFVSIYNELYHAANGSNWISVYLSPLLREGAVVGVRPGRWVIRLEGQDVRAGDYHAWIERDDPRRVGRLGPTKEAWVFPSFFSEASNVDHHSVGSLACGQRVIAVANLDMVAERINKSSSQGPTRDGRSKPDIAAPGTDIVAAKGFGDADNLWIGMTGTSMASPYVAGVVGLMFAVEPKLTAAQVEGIMHRTGRPLPGADYTWSDAAGFGQIDPDGCIAEAARANRREDLTDEP